MSLIINQYNSYIFDCDGVVLNSNKIKSNAYYQIGLEYGELVAEKLLAFHLKHAGASRYVKFNYLISNLVEYCCDDKNIKILELSNNFSNIIRVKMNSCEINPELENFKNSTLGANWILVTGTDQSEVRELFKKRRIDHLFDGGIYGSPKNKIEIFNELIQNNSIKLPSVYIGDSQFDYESAIKCGLDFVFYSNWTEMHKWKEFTTLNNIRPLNSFNDWKF